MHNTDTGCVFLCLHSVSAKTGLCSLFYLAWDCHGSIRACAKVSEVTQLMLYWLICTQQFWQTNRYYFFGKPKWLKIKHLVNLHIPSHQTILGIFTKKHLITYVVAYDCTFLQWNQSYLNCVIVRMHHVLCWSRWTAQFICRMHLGKTVLGVRDKSMHSTVQRFKALTMF